MNEEIKKPKNLAECFRCLDGIIKESPDSEWFKNSEEKDAVSQSHHGLGQWIRNNWELWKEDSDLYQYFNKLGLHHSDDMSGVVLTSYHRHLNKKELELDGQINYYIDFWKKNSK